MIASNFPLVLQDGQTEFPIGVLATLLRLPQAKKKKKKNIKIGNTFSYCLVNDIWDIKKHLPNCAVTA